MNELIILVIGLATTSILISTARPRLAKVAVKK